MVKLGSFISSSTAAAAELARQLKVTADRSVHCCGDRTPQITGQSVRRLQAYDDFRPYRNSRLNVSSSELQGSSLIDLQLGPLDAPFRMSPVLFLQVVPQWTTKSRSRSQGPTTDLQCGLLDAQIRGPNRNRSRQTYPKQMVRFESVQGKCRPTAVTCVFRSPAL